MSFTENLQQSLAFTWERIVAFAPQMLAAVLLLAAGWVLARVLRRGSIRLFRWMRLDEVSEKAGIEGFLIQGGIRFTAVTLLGNLIYWFVLFAVMLATLNVLGLQAANELLNRVLLYIPNVVVAVLVLLFGSLLGKFARAASFAYLSNIGIEGAAFLSHLAQWAIMIFVASVAMEQLSIGGQIVTSAFQIAFAAFCFALALAFGLGGQRRAAEILDKVWKA